MYTSPLSLAIAPFVNTTFDTSPTLSAPSGAIKNPPGSAITFVGSSSDVANAYMTYLSPAAVFLKQ